MHLCNSADFMPKQSKRFRHAWIAISLATMIKHLVRRIQVLKIIHPKIKAERIKPNEASKLRINKCTWT